MKKMYDETQYRFKNKFNDYNSGLKVVKGKHKCDFIYMEIPHPFGDSPSQKANKLHRRPVDA